jgi:D-lactate dehydrogenase (cytochrome)
VSWGVARQQALGLEVVLADGRVLNNLNKLKKDNTGYDLKNLFIGAEGTLGVITAATLRMIPRPRSVETAFVGVASPDAALALLGIASERTGGGVTSFELMLRLGIEAVLQYATGCRDPLNDAHPWYVLIELSSQARAGLRDTLEAIWHEGVERGLVADAANRRQPRADQGLLAHPRDVRRGAAPGRRLDQARHLGAGRACAGLHPRGRCGGDQAHPGRAAAAVRPSRRRQHPLQCGAAGRRRQSRVLERWHDVNKVVFDVVLKYGGSISAEHGIGIMKRDILPTIKDPVAMDLMRALKRTLDPNGILNPGKVL